MKIVFFGTSEFAIPALKALHAAHFDITIVTMPDQLAGRKKVLTAPPVSLAALELGITIHQPPSLKNDNFFESFKSLKPDLCVVASYGKIIPARYLDVPKYFLNIHPSLLPKYRGPTPIQTAILNGDKETGVTIMQVDAEMDHGSILLQEEFPIQPDDTYLELHDRLATEGARLLLNTIVDLDSITPQEQDHSKATFTKMLERTDGRIDWSQSGEKIYNQIRALNPEPGTWTTWKDKVLNISSAGILEKLPNEKAGTVVEVDNQILVAANTCYIHLKTIQLEGRNETAAASFRTGHPGFINSTLE